MPLSAKLAIFGDSSECTMDLFEHSWAVPKDVALRVVSAGGATCRLQELKEGIGSAKECARSCLDQPLCAAATFFPPAPSTPSALHGRCIGRTVGPNNWFGQDDNTNSIAAFKRCTAPGCNLQSRLDQACVEIARRSGKGACAGARFARNDGSQLPNYKRSPDRAHWMCMNPPGSSNVRLTLGCVDDRGHPQPCAYDDGPIGGACHRLAKQTNEFKEHNVRLLAIHQLGCNTTNHGCLATPGGGPLSPSELLLRPPPPPAPPPRHPRAHGPRAAAEPPASSYWVAANHSDRVEALQQHGYRQCVIQGDEGYANCGNKTSDSWLHWAWTPLHGRRRRRGGTHEGSPQAASSVTSWWLGAHGADAFDAVEFIAQLQERGKRLGKMAEVHILGDSVSRQQGLSLCCLLSAGGAASGKFSVALKLVGASGFRASFSCEVRSPDRGHLITRVVMTRINTGSEWQGGAAPVLTDELLAIVKQAPAVLVINFGAWDYQEGCDDGRSTGATFCNGTRAWMYRDYARVWSVVGAALEASYPEGSAKRMHSVVAVRTGTPREHVCKPNDPLGGVDCYGKRAEMQCRLGVQGPGLGEPSEATADGAMEARELRENKASHMRLAVLSQNAIMMSLMWQRHPWVRVLDAYGISRLRPDAHCPFDCTHYCLPGIPDLWNGRLASMLNDVELADSEPAALLRRWHRDDGFVSGVPPNLRLNLGAAGLVDVACPASSTRPAGGLGECSDAR